MTSEKRPPSDQPGARRRRPPTVIDLEATEVPENVASKPADDTGQQQRADGSSVAPAVKPDEKPDENTSGEIASQPASSQETAKQEPETAKEALGPSALSGTKAPASPEPPRSEPIHASSEQPAPPPPPRPAWLPLLAGVSGVAGGLLAFPLLWAVGAFPDNQPAPPPDHTPKFAAIERQLNELASRPASAGVDPRALDDLAARLGRIESAQSAPRAPVTDPVVLGRINSAESAMKSLADNVAAMSRRMDGIDAALREGNGKFEKLPAALAELQTRAREANANIETLSASVNQLQTQAREAAAGTDRASRLAVAAGALRAAIERGDPYSAELAIVKPLATDSAAIAALEPFSNSGVPSAAALGQELAAMIRPMLRAAGEVPRDGSFLDKLQANAEKLVRIRPADEPPGGDRIAILSRIEQRASQGNIAGARSELAKLPAEARAPVQAALEAWTAKAEARDKAIETSHRLASDAVAALKVSP